MAMQIHKITENYAVSPQIRPADIADASELGYTAIVNNRPDGEGLGQPKSDVLAAEAEALGVAYFHIPVKKGDLNAGHVDALKTVMAQADGPVLAFCASGMRSSMVWALSQNGEMGADSIVQAVAEAGYDISPLKPKLG